MLTGPFKDPMYGLQVLYNGYLLYPIFQKKSTISLPFV
jgi:hypothetical protein